MGWQEDFQRTGQQKMAAALVPPVAGNLHASGLPQQYADGIKKHEGFDRKAFWDYKQWTNGFGTRAAHPGEVIDRDTAEARFANELGKAKQAVDKFAPNLPEGPKAALTSLTYNGGDKWMRSGLGAAVKSGDLDGARNRFVQYNKAGGKPLPGLVQRRNDEAKWFAGTTVQREPQTAAFTQPQTLNTDGVVSTAGLNGPSAQPIQTAQPAALAPPNVQQASYSPTSAPQPSRGTNPTPGREVLSMNGLTPEQKRDALQGAYDRGNRDMVYVHDDRERVVARPGEARWSPQGSDDPSKAGPNFANTFMVDNGYGAAPRPMADDNPLKGSRYDDGTFTGGLPSNGAPSPGVQPPQMVASAVPSSGAAPPSPQLSGSGLQAVQSAALAPLMLSTTPPSQIKTIEPPMQTAALKPPEFNGAIKANAPGNVATSDSNVSKQLASVPTGTQGATEVAAGLTGPAPKQNLGGTPQISAIPPMETNAPNNTGAGRTNQAPAPDSAPAPAGVQPPTKIASAPETPTPAPVDLKTQPNTVTPEPSQVQAEKPSSRMALGGPPTRPETETVKPLQGMVSELFGVAPTNKPLEAVGAKISSALKPGGAGTNGPNGFPQWNLNPANPGIQWKSGGFSGFGAN